jgi:quaternary ammonium compound-resistance protein SugE
MTAWLTLLTAGALEIAWAIGLKYSQGLRRPVPGALTIAAMILSMWLLARASRDLPIGTAYAVWTGIGAAGTAILGMILFQESREWPRLLCLGMIVCGILGLRVWSRP